MFLKGILSTLRELFQFLWERKYWWLIPMIVVLLFFAFIIVLGGAAGVGPFIYTLF